MALAEWVAKGEPPFDVWPVDIRRFGRGHLRHGLGAHPHAGGLRQALRHGLAVRGAPISGRPLRRSPLYERLQEQGACFGEKLGWERPNWFAGPGEEPVDRYSFGRQNWFEAVGREHRACRERVALFDQTSFAKFLLVGRDAERGAVLAVRQRRGEAAGQPDLHPDAERRGRHRVRPDRGAAAEDRFYLVTGTGFATHDFDWISAQHPGRARRRIWSTSPAPMRCCRCSARGPARCWAR